ncbi:MAG: UDP-N-acetylmuramoyl-tripeptide--D-alanyl-D-alanine ligase [Gammaproteobacteria bacterium]|nr:UDP-N-acetylmuramoyl-tripeptide--D-alanyl-D-alanine ligase [Gammaproteobacteria bacterium]
MTAFRWTHPRVQAALSLRDAPAFAGTGFAGVSTDTRTLAAGELFVAIAGENFDGHDFVCDAVAAGAAGVVVSRAVAMEASVPVYRVPDTLAALGRLARYRRRRHAAQVVAITGSSGKTTTKEFLRGALQRSYRVHANPGNLNNRIGLPLTILGAPDAAEVLVLEMGTNEPGEIAALTAVAEPDIAAVTTISDAHLEKLGSLEGVFQEKLALVAGLDGRGAVVVGDQPPALPERARALHPNVRVAGWSDAADANLRPQNPHPDAHGRYFFDWRNQRVHLQVPGRHAVYDALIALAISDLLQTPHGPAVRGLEQYRPQGMRGEQLHAGDLTLLLDCYNANPQSVRAALDLLGLIPSAGRRVAVLGSMLELGDRSAALHDELLSEALSRAVDVVLALGEFAAAAERLHKTGRQGSEPALLASADAAEGYALLRGFLEGNELILLKGSRGVALERLVPLIEADFGPAVRNGAR